MSYSDQCLSSLDRIILARGGADPPVAMSPIGDTFAKLKKKTVVVVRDVFFVRGSKLPVPPLSFLSMRPPAQQPP